MGSLGLHLHDTMMLIVNVNYLKIILIFIIKYYNGEYIIILYYNSFINLFILYIFFFFFNNNNKFYPFLLEMVSKIEARGKGNWLLKIII